MVPPVPYTVRRQDQLIDYDALAEIAEREKPKLIIAGGSAYSREIDFKRSSARSPTASAPT